MDFVAAAVIASSVLATVDDLRRRQIANWIPAAATLAGVVWHIALAGWQGAVYALLGWAAGAAVFLIFYLAGGLGAGDIKFMAGLGALLGSSGILLAAVLAAIAGALHAAGVLLWRRVSHAAGARISIPYAPSIAAGACLALLGRV